MRDTPGRFDLVRLKTAVTRLEGWWFDFTRGVHTGLAHESPGAVADFFPYLPTRPSRVRKILRDLPIHSYREYSFIDLGSGKGRALLIAAEWPFQLIQGVEYDAVLHEQAEQNIRVYLESKRLESKRLESKKLESKKPDSRIESQNMDAMDYHFPAGNLVVFLFNPFGPRVLNGVLGNLVASLEASPRTIFLTLVSPAPTAVVSRMECFHLYKQTRGYSIYRVG
jgi:hypothetical protein